MSVAVRPPYASRLLPILERRPSAARNRARTPLVVQGMRSEETQLVGNRRGAANSGR